MNSPRNTDVKMKIRSMIVPCLLMLALGGGLLLAQSRAAFKVVVHPDNPTTELSKNEVSRLFLKKTTRWDSGSRSAVKPVDLLQGSQLRETFSQDIHNRSASEIKSYWQQRIFSGRGVPPPELKSEEDVLEYVRSNPAAIGYVSKSASTSGVRVLELTD